MKCESNKSFLSWCWGFFSDELPQELDLDMVPSSFHASSDLLVLKLPIYLHIDRFFSQYLIYKVQNTAEEQYLRLSRWRRVRWLWWKSWFTAPGLHWSNLTEIRNSTLLKPRVGSGSAEWWTFVFIQKIKCHPPCVPVFQLSPAHLTWTKQPLPYEQRDPRTGHWRTGLHSTLEFQKILANWK